MPADGYLRRVLVDGARPFRYRGGVRALLGEPDGPGLLRATPPAPQPQFSYPRSAWAGETEVPDRTLTMARGPRDWPGGNDRPRGHRDRGPAAGDARHGPPDQTPGPATGHPPAVTAEPGPRPGATGRPSVVLDVNPAPVHGPAAVTPPGSVRAESVRAESVQAESVQAGRPMITESAQHMAAEDAWPGPAGRAAALEGRGPKPAASAGGSRELLIPGTTVRSPVMAGSEQADVRPGPPGLTGPVSKGQPDGTPRRSATEPVRMDGREPAPTDGSDDRSVPDPGRTVRRIPPPQATARKHGGGTVIPGGRAAPAHLQQPAGPGLGPTGQLVTPPPWRPVPEPGLSSREEPLPAPSPVAAPVAAPQIVVTLPSRAQVPPRAFWERRHLGRLWSRPLR